MRDTVLVVSRPERIPFVFPVIFKITKFHDNPSKQIYRHFYHLD